MAVMDYEEFNKLIDKAVRRINHEEEMINPVFLVHFRYKHTCEEKWRYTTELFMLDSYHDSYYWEMDWWEGEKEIEPYGIQSLDAVEIPCNLNPLPSI